MVFFFTNSSFNTETFEEYAHAFSKQFLFLFCSQYNVYITGKPGKLEVISYLAETFFFIGNTLFNQNI